MHEGGEFVRQKLIGGDLVHADHDSGSGKEWKRPFRQIY
jgi:hypothetical protein